MRICSGARAARRSCGGATLHTSGRVVRAVDGGVEAVRSNGRASVAGSSVSRGPKTAWCVIGAQSTTPKQNPAIATQPAERGGRSGRWTSRVGFMAALVSLRATRPPPTLPAGRAYVTHAPCDRSSHWTRRSTLLAGCSHTRRALPPAVSETETQSQSYGYYAGAANRSRGCRQLRMVRAWPPSCPSIGTLARVAETAPVEPDCGDRPVAGHSPPAWTRRHSQDHDRACSGQGRGR